MGYRGRMRLAAGVIVAFAVWTQAGSADADFEVTGPDGRRILLKDDRTWSYLEGAAEAKPAGDAGAAKARPTATAALHLERVVQRGPGCSLRLRMVNELPYEIRSVVPEFSAYREKDIRYDTVFMSFEAIKPGDQQVKDIVFRGMPCGEIAAVKVGGADRCEMGDLDKFTPERGACLARIRVVESQALKFTK